MFASYFAVAAVFIVSAFLCRELARKGDRDQVFYFVAGLLAGPLALMVVLTPLPETYREKKGPRKAPRFVKGAECPACHRQVPVRMYECPHCRYNLEVPWWDKPIAWRHQ